jgi:hypothetical protein
MSYQLVTRFVFPHSKYIHTLKQCHLYPQTFSILTLCSYTAKSLG